MKKLIIFLLLLSPVSAQFFPSVQVVSYDVSDTIPPSGIGTIKVLLANYGNVSASIKQAFLYAPGFETIAGDYKNLGSLAPLQQTELTFIFRAPPQEGVYTPEVRIDLETGEDLRYPIPVKISSSPELFVAGLSFHEIGIGEIKDLRIDVGSYGKILAKKVEAELDPLDVSPVDPVGPSKIFIGDVSNESFSLSYRIHVKSGTPENVYSVPLFLRWLSGIDGTRKEDVLSIGMKVSGIKEPSLEVQKEVPASVLPGEDFSVVLKITNKGEVKATGINVIVNLSGVPVTSRGPDNLYIEELLPGENESLMFNFTSGKSPPLGIYSIPVVVSYMSPLGNKFQLETVGIRGIPELSVASISSDPVRIMEGEFATLTIRIENTGSADAKSAIARIDLPFEGDKESVIGKIEPDEDVPAIFILRAGSPGLYSYKISVEYEDDFGSHEFEHTSEIFVYSKRFPIELIVIFAVALLIFYIYRRRK